MLPFKKEMLQSCMSLLEKFYKQEVNSSGFKERRFKIPSHSCNISGVTLVGKTALVREYLSQMKRSQYLYIDCKDLRINISEFNAQIDQFCDDNSISTVALDSYTSEFKLPDVKQVITVTHSPIEDSRSTHYRVLPLDFEEFIAHRNRFDETLLNDYLQLGGLVAQHKITQNDRAGHIQQALKAALDEIELDTLITISKLYTQKISAFMLYERLKNSRRISKDRLYRSFKALSTRGYILSVEKLHNQNATDKIYLCDISIIDALNAQKNFSRLFENLVFCELYKRHEKVYYDDKIEFILPEHSQLILCMPFGTREQLFKKIESIESTIITNAIKKITIITMSSEAKLEHPYAKVQMLPFTQWALSD